MNQKEFGVKMNGGERGKDRGVLGQESQGVSGNVRSGIPSQ